VKKQQLVAVSIFLLVVAWLFMPHNAEISEGNVEAPKTVIATSEADRASETPGVISVRAEKIS
ncbi:uncharacterized protein METZ01_LOCUS433314, partial [marine metagenome]